MKSRLQMVRNILYLYILLDIYTFFGLRSLFSGRSKIWFSLVYWATSTYFYYSFYQLYQVLESGSIFRDSSANIYLGLFLTALVGKLFFSVLMLFQDVGRILSGTGSLAKRLSQSQPQPAENTFLPARRKFLTMGAALLAAMPFSTMLYGITRGKYRYTLEKLVLNFPDLPLAFDGLKVIQISDIHAGSFDDPEEVAKGVELINEQKPDLILFTGDLVNSDKNEVDPYLEMFGSLSAKYGKFSVLGNHDYYGVPEDPQAEKAYWADFNQKYKTMGFQLLNNDQAAINIGTDRIQILGVENWGAGRWFPKKGDLDQALTKVAADDFCILLSHDPSHWDEKVLSNPRHIPLTLSGHTHGFQFGINVPGFKWSPAQYRYPHWMGLYEKNGQKLYVNKGFGFLGFPGRVGMWPEITVFELKRNIS